MDFQKAFDSFNRQTLRKLLRYYGVPSKNVNIIRKFYEAFTAPVVNNRVISDADRCETGMSALPPSVPYCLRLGDERGMLIIR